MAEVSIGDRDQALDLVQETMIQLVRRYQDRPSQEWRPLFYRCLQNRIRDWHRRQKVRRALFWQPPTQTEEGPAPMPEAPDPAGIDGAEALQRAQAMRKLEAALAGLPRRQREAFELRLWEGMDVAETAQCMACSQGSVKTHLSRALARLRSELEGVWP